MKCRYCDTDMIDISGKLSTGYGCTACKARAILNLWGDIEWEPEEPIIPKNHTKKFTFEFTYTDKGIHIKGINEGWSPIEILGILEWKRDDIMRQIRGEIKPDVVERTFIKDQEGSEELPTRPV